MIRYPVYIRVPRNKLNARYQQVYFHYIYLTLKLGVRKLRGTGIVGSVLANSSDIRHQTTIAENIDHFGLKREDLIRIPTDTISNL